MEKLFVFSFCSFLRIFKYQLKRFELVFHTVLPQLNHDWFASRKSQC